MPYKFKMPPHNHNNNQHQNLYPNTNNIKQSNASQIKIKIHESNNNKKVHQLSDPKKIQSNGRNYVQIACRIVLLITCLWSILNQAHIAYMMFEYPSYESYNVAKPGEGVTDFEKSVCFLITSFCFIGIHCAIVNDKFKYKNHVLMGLFLAGLMILPILCYGELKSSYKVLTDRVRLLNRDIGFWQLDLIIKKKIDPDNENYMELANNLQKLGCCGITNATQWTEGLRLERNFEYGYDFYPASCCVSHLRRVCTADKLCACRPYDEGCLTVTFEAMQEYFKQRYLQVADLLLLSLLSYICYRKTTKLSSPGKKQKGSNVSNV